MGLNQISFNNSDFCRIEKKELAGCKMIIFFKHPLSALNAQEVEKEMVEQTT